MEKTELEKHFGEGPEVEIEGVKIELKPLTLKYLPHLYRLYKAFSGSAGKEIGTEDIFKNMNDDTMASIQVLIEETLKRSCLDKDEQWRQEMGLKYSLVLLTKIMTINSAGTDIAAEKRDRLMQTIGKK